MTIPRRRPIPVTETSVQVDSSVADLRVCHEDIVSKPPSDKNKAFGKRAKVRMRATAWHTYV